MDTRVKAVIVQMQKSLTDQLSIRTLATKVNLSPSRLWQLFRKETGQSPMQYLKDLRMRHARNLLRSTFHSIKEIAFLSGASDLSHFVRDFKKEYGVRPTEFRAQSKRPANVRTWADDDRE